MKIEEIIDKLCSHDISKVEAIKEIRSITNGLINKDALEFEVESFGFTTENNHGYLKLKLPYQYSKMAGKFNKEDKVNLMVIP